VLPLATGQTQAAIQVQLGDERAEAVAHQDFNNGSITTQMAGR
jgi:hypothetical protein